MAVALGGCIADDNKNNDLSGALAESLLEAAKQQQQAEPSTPVPAETSAQPNESDVLPRESDEPTQDPPAIDDLAEALTGWWVCMDEGSIDPQFPIIN